MTRFLDTTSGRVDFPAFLPVTTFGGKFPLDDLVRPYLIRFAPALMVSYHYALSMKERPKGILFLDSGGFASLFDGAGMVAEPQYVSIRTKDGDTISPEDVLRFQERHADIGATLDFIIPPSCDPSDAQRRQRATIRNAVWAIENRQHPHMKLYASVQAWDATSASEAMRQLAPHPFDGFALGGMVPRVKAPETVFAIIRAIRDVDSMRPLHVFGIGAPELVRHLFDLGVDSVDSSNYVRAAVDGTIFEAGHRPDLRSEDVTTVSVPCQCQACTRLGLDYFQLEGETNRMAVALHNLAVLVGKLPLHGSYTVPARA